MQCSSSLASLTKRRSLICRHTPHPMAAGNAGGAGGNPNTSHSIHAAHGGTARATVTCGPSPVPQPRSCRAATNPGSQRTVTPSCRYMGYVPCSKHTPVAALFLPIWECVFPAGSSASLHLPTTVSFFGVSRDDPSSDSAVSCGSV